jgi:mono/diheme cytochrome c family protein
MKMLMGNGRLLAVAMVAVVAGASSAWAGATEGKTVYEQHCKMCHSIAGEGGKMAKTGGPLDGVGAKHDQAWLKAYITDPKSKVPTSKMPKVKLSPEQLDDVSAYLATLKEAAAKK